MICFRDSECPRHAVLMDSITAGLVVLQVPLLQSECVSEWEEPLLMLRECMP